MAKNQNDLAYKFEVVFYQIVIQNIEHNLFADLSQGSMQKNLKTMDLEWQPSL